MTNEFKQPTEMLEVQGMRSILMSIKPKYCELIANGKKTIEIRKTKPNLSTPFKCYVYETKGRATLKAKASAPWNSDEITNFYIHEGSGKVIGEFVCDKIDVYEMEGFTCRDNVYQAITRIELDDGDELQYTEAANDMSPEELSKSRIIKESCVKFDDIGKYACGAVFGFYKFYGWHISDLMIYDEPKELSEFIGIRDFKYSFEVRTLDRPPQSWCYVKEVQE